MDNKLDSLEEVRATLQLLRQDANARRHFPREFWDAIIRLTKIYSIKEVAHQLKINPNYLKRKVHPPQAAPIEFREISLQSPSQDLVTIELSSKSGCKAVIRGPLSCLSCIHHFFKG